MLNLNRRHFLSLLGTSGVHALGLSSAEGRSLQPPGAATFPALRQQIGGRPLTYLDSAATTLRPQAVIDALADFYATDNANPAPVHTLARRAASRLTAARQTVARFINAPSPNELVFTRGTTEGINLIAGTWGAANLRPGAMGKDATWRHDQDLVRHGLARLREVKGLRLIGSSSPQNRVPVFTFAVEGKSPAAIANALDSRGIAIRAGDMAALPLLKRFGVSEAARASAYVYSTRADIDHLVDALVEL